ncbi:putative transcription factor iiic-like protein [Diplodia corticola]|uniref:Putative transcription factor iiic-like protein n=1 Tax=Diplodia corticola TaxID=236234 RepID=A0A1J9QLF5_9PEZI|nr:putative transcription factor iiic-like protein [Diplodia corticola]OJD29734.1 putative transcription factor iiic-like protein [Diplodia corticola]
MTPITQRELDLERDDSSDDSGPIPRSQRSSRTFFASGRAKRQKKITLAQPDESLPKVKEEDNDTPEKVLESDSSSEDIPVRKRAQPATPKVGASKKSKKRKASPDSSQGSPQANKRQTRASKRGRKSRQAAVGISEDSEDLEIVGGPSNASTRDSDFGEPESSDDNVLPSSPGAIPRKKRGKRSPKVYSEDEASDDMPVSTRKRRAPPVSDSEDEPVTQSSRIRSPLAVQQEREDLAEDLEFLGSSPRKLDVPRRPRKAPPAMNARQRALEALRRRRAGEKDLSPEVEEEVRSRRQRALYDTDSESESEADQDQDDEEEANDDEDELSDRPHARVHQATTMDMFQEDDDDEDFLVEDDEDETIGVPGETDTIPLAFTSISRAKGKDLFKYAVEWMVQKKLNPGFAKDDEIYRLTFRKLDDEVKGLAGSKFTSSAWTRDFTRALHARPRLDSVELGGASRALLENHCQACNRRTHPATWDIMLTGKAYKGDTLSDVEDNDSSDSDESEDSDLDDEDRRSVDANGHSLPPESTVFHVGVHCKNNAETAHTLTHWRWHLYDWVKDHLQMQGHLDAEKIVERDGWKTKKRTKYANKVVDEMQANGEIKKLWHDFRATINTAREAKQAGYSRYAR